MTDEQASKPAHPRIDLDTVRETLAYMHGDMASAPELAQVHQALGRVLDEIAAIAPNVTSQHLSTKSNVIALHGPRFVPWTAPGSR